MTKRTEKLGYDSGQGSGSDRYLSPGKPQTGDGRTTRSIFDKVRVVFKRS